MYICIYTDKHGCVLCCTQTYPLDPDAMPSLGPLRTKRPRGLGFRVLKTLNSSLNPESPPKSCKDPSAQVVKGKPFQHEALW